MSSGPLMRDSLILVAGHGIFHRGIWHGVPSAGDESALEQHLVDAFGISRRLGFRALVLSGGHTRPELSEASGAAVSHSEAAGMQAFAEMRGLDAGRAVVLREEWARDSFENVLYSVLAYHQHFGA